MDVCFCGLDAISRQYISAGTMTGIQYVILQK